MYPARLHDYHPVVVHDGALTMCDADDGALFEVLPDDALHPFVCDGVHVCGGLINAQNLILDAISTNNNP